jgi:hypothetical protein
MSVVEGCKMMMMMMMMMMMVWWWKVEVLDARAMFLSWRLNELTKWKERTAEATSLGVNGDFGVFVFEAGYEIMKQAHLGCDRELPVLV